MNRRGFALLTVLWVMLAASVMATAGAVAAREAVDAAANRIEQERAFWHANDCLERALASVDASLGQLSDKAASNAWLHLERRVEAPLTATQCDIALEPAGARIDINAASRQQLELVLDLIGAADSRNLALEILTARERPIGDLRAIAALHPGVSDTAFSDVLSVEPGHLCINHASDAALRAIPGMSAEVVASIMLERSSGRDFSDVPSLASRVSRAAAESLMVHYREIISYTVTTPDAWIVTARGWSGSPPAHVHMDARVVRDGRRAAVVRRRAWSQ